MNPKLLEEHNMISRFIRLLSEKNDKIRLINFAVIKLNDKITEEIAQSPEIVDCDFPQDRFPIKTYLWRDYPYIHVQLPPYKTSILYDDIIQSLQGNFEIDHISNVLISILCEKLICEPK